MADIPDFLPPAAKANPPPSKNTRDHGVLVLMYFQVKSGPVAAFGSGLLLVVLKKRKHLQFAGNMKNIMTMKIAGVASFIFLLRV